MRVITNIYYPYIDKYTLNQGYSYVAKYVYVVDQIATVHVTGYAKNHTFAIDICDRILENLPSTHQ